MAGSIYTCQNNGVCTTSNGVGVCQCQSGYSGLYCATALGCVAGGSYACQNGGACNSATGICTCPTGYTGNYCASCRIFFYDSKYSIDFFYFGVCTFICDCSSSKSVVALDIKREMLEKLRVIFDFTLAVN